LIIQADDEDHYSTYPTVADDISVALPLTDDESPKRKTMERNRLARQIIDTCLEMTRLGLNQGTAGNVSVRYQGGC
jgi:hypothetical protein